MEISGSHHKNQQVKPQPNNTDTTANQTKNPQQPDSTKTGNVDLKSLSVAQLNKLSTSQLNKLDATQLNKLNTAQLNKLSGSQLSKLNSSSMAKLNDSQKAKLGADSTVENKYADQVKISDAGKQKLVQSQKEQQSQVQI